MLCSELFDLLTRKAVPEEFNIVSGTIFQFVTLGPKVV